MRIVLRVDRHPRCLRFRDRRSRPRPRASPCRRARARMTSRPDRTASSGTPRKARARSAASIPRPARSSRSSLGGDSAPHGVIVGPDGAPWITDGGQNAIVRVDPKTRAVKVYPLPEARGYVNLNTAVFDKAGMLWFTGQNGVYGRLDPKSGKIDVWDAPRGRGPYGITATPDGAVYYASLAGSHIARIDHRDRRRHDHRAADQGPGRAPRLVGQRGPRLGQRMERRPGQRLRSGEERVEVVAPAGRAAACLRRLRRRQGQGVAQRMGRQCRGALRSGDREVRRLPQCAQRRRRAPDSRPARRGVDSRIGHRPRHRDQGQVIGVRGRFVAFAVAALVLGARRARRTPKAPPIPARALSRNASPATASIRPSAACPGPISFTSSAGRPRRSTTTIIPTP